MVIVYLVLGDSVPVQHEQLERDVVERGAGRGRHLEHERLVEHRVQGALLHVRLLLGDALPVVQQVHLHVAADIKHVECSG